jgi:fructose-1,6-bisphosphatase I
MYPERAKHPEGKLRLLFEVNPMSYIVQKAGGQADSLGRDPLSIQPEKISQRVPIVMGSKNMVQEFKQYDQRI